MDDTDPDKLDAVRERLEAEQARRLAERIEAGEIVSVPIFVVAGSESEARARAEEAKADKLAELRAAGDQCEVVFDVTMAVTGVLRPGEVADPASVPTAPTFSSREDAAIRPPLPSPVVAVGTMRAPDEVVEEEVVWEEPQPPIIESYVQVQVRQCRGDDDPGQIAEGWFSVDAGHVTVTDANGKYVGSRAMLEGEDARVVAKQLLRGKKAPEEEFNRPLSYPNAGLA
jgi:hypothetical protein